LGAIPSAPNLGCRGFCCGLLPSVVNSLNRKCEKKAIQAGKIINGSVRMAGYYSLSCLAKKRWKNIPFGKNPLETKTTLDVTKIYISFDSEEK
jgi:hypothetical protein